MYKCNTIGRVATRLQKCERESCAHIIGEGEVVYFKCLSNSGLFVQILQLDDNYAALILRQASVQPIQYMCTPGLLYG